MKGLDLAIEWHQKQKLMCIKVFKDEPRLSEEIRKKAEIAANHHGASAAGLMMLQRKLMLEEKETEKEDW